MRVGSGALLLGCLVVAPAAQSTPCLPAALLRGAEVVVLDVAGGAGAIAPIGLADTRHPTFVVRVRGDGSGKPIVLVVSAFQPTIWDVSQVPTRRLRAIVAYGFYPPGVSGASLTVPVTFGWAGPSGNDLFTGCGALNLGFSGTGLVPTYQAQIKDAIGAGPDRYFGGYDPATLDIDVGSAPWSPPDLKLRALRLPRNVVPGLPPPRLVVNDSVKYGGEVKTRLHWNGGVVLERDVEPPWSVRPRPAVIDAALRRRAIAPSMASRDDAGTLLALIGLGIAAAFVLAWRRARGDRLPQPLLRFRDFVAGRIAADYTVDNAIPIEAEPELHGAAATALQSYRAAARRTDEVAPLDADLADEAAVITGQRFPDLIGSFRRASRAHEPDAATEALLVDGLDRLTEQLSEIADAQRRRDGDALRTNARFLETRYPRGQAR